MIELHPQFIKDDLGNNTFVVLSANEFDSLIENIEENEDIKLFDSVISDTKTTYTRLEDFKLELGL